MRKLTLSLGLAAVCATSLVAIAPAATAAESGPQAAACFTLWDTNGFRDGSRAFSGNDKTFSGDKWSSGSAMNDDANAAKNRCGHWVHLHQDVNYQGQSYGLKPHSEDSDFENNNFANKASSLNGF
ncbi:peptidase inhibitor family I36 protein [Streptomyces alboniger]|uniref:Beta/gamma crystallin 'Greek key' domain-containing protein n=1 Tax=Streptomyces alboniger TaxID=132473 RepID=A0A5J6HRV3_STRAD|nr:peptidase inhibitor family I36 protein [Streptomyces alboniger]QEV21071.1 hypothetical protein CP975_29120 [Streptomyces alboniger]